MTLGRWGWEGRGQEEKLSIAKGVGKIPWKITTFKVNLKI